MTDQPPLSPSLRAQAEQLAKSLDILMGDRFHDPDGKYAASDADYIAQIAAALLSVQQETMKNCARWMHHDQDCKLNEPWDSVPPKSLVYCTCGLAAALRSPVPQGPGRWDEGPLTLLPRVGKLTGKQRPPHTALFTDGRARQNKACSL
jgi:hypothetical protein